MYKLRMWATKKLVKIAILMNPEISEAKRKILLAQENIDKVEKQFHAKS